MWNPANLYTHSVYLLFVTYQKSRTSIAIIIRNFSFRRKQSAKAIISWSLCDPKVFIESDDIRLFYHLIFREIRTGFVSKQVFSVSQYRRPQRLSAKFHHKNSTLPPYLAKYTAHRSTLDVPLCTSCTCTWKIRFRCECESCKSHLENIGLHCAKFPDKILANSSEDNSTSHTYITVALNLYNV